MNIVLGRRLASVSALALSLAAGTAAAQELVPLKVPLNDITCTNSFSMSASCSVDGTRTVTPTGTTIQILPNAPRQTTTRNFRVDFDGMLAITGTSYSSVGGEQAIFGGTNASFLFNPNIATVDLKASYDAARIFSTPIGVTPAIQPENWPFTRISNFTTDVRSIGVNVTDTATDANGTTYNFGLRTIDPTAVVNNSVALTGTYAGRTELGGLTFGTLGGTASLVAPAGLTQLRNPEGQLLAAFYTPYAMEYTVAAQQTTSVDETGIVTPKIAVTQGIDMNGSRVTNLAAGEQPGDAVNRAQLDEVSGAIAFEADSRRAGDDFLNGKIETESSNRVAMDNLLTGWIVDDRIAREEADARLAATDVELAGAIAFEADSRKAGDDFLNGKIETESSNRVAMDNQLTGWIVADRLAREGADARLAAADAELAGSIAFEADSRRAGDDFLNAKIETESSNRVAVDNQLSNRIIGEAQARQQADLQLNQRIEVERSAREQLATGLANEINARVAGDNALSNRIDVMGNRIDTLDSRLDRVERRMAAGTAVAVAMSGNTFLPDTKFNLTANVGTYDGAHAGSMQVGALVRPNVAVNAGIATGFNRGGKTAARAGFTFGW